MRKLKRGRGNIKPELAYDPFPKAGLVKQYEPFIRKHVGEFCRRYPGLLRDDVLSEAIRNSVQSREALQTRARLRFLDVPAKPFERLRAFRGQGSIA
jgi:hypothetical protein